MNLVLLAVTVLQAAPAENRLLVIQGADTVAHAATDTIDVAVGQTLELIPEIVASGTILSRGDLWVHNTSPEFVDFDPPIGDDRFSADPIRVTGVNPGPARVMVHWSVQSGGFVFIVFRVVDSKATPPRYTSEQIIRMARRTAPTTSRS